ncbi:MAG: GtrA family protein [Acetobacteraceae bacterium]|nr:GtrA family protein [Acetobacteraceae bacterium]
MRDGALRRLADEKLVRFLAVGGLNALFGYAMFALGVLVGLPPEVALLVATVLGVLFNFITTGRLVFGVSNRRLLPRFCLVYGAVYLLNSAVLRLLVVAGVSPFLAQAGLVPISAAVTFLLMKSFVFSERLA